MDSQVDGVEPHPLTNYGAALRRRWPTVVLLGVVGLLIGLLVTLVMPKHYTSVALVQVTPTGVPDTTTTTTNSRTQGAVNLDNEAQLVKSTPVVARAAFLLGNASNVSIADNVSVASPANTQLLSISYSASSPAAAQQGASAFAHAYLDVRSTTAQAALNAKVDALAGQITGLQNQLRDLAGQVASLPVSSSSHAFAAAQQNVVSQQIGSLNTTLAQLRGTPITPGVIASDATNPTSASSPVPLLNIASGAVAGLAIGALLVLLMARSRPSKKIHHLEDVSSFVDGRVVVAPAIGNGKRAVVDRRIARKHYQQLANSLLFISDNRPIVVVVTGVTAGSSGAFAAAGLAEAISRTGLRAALVDADLESGTLSALVSATNEPGLSDVLLDGRPVEEVAHATTNPGYDLLPVGARADELVRTAPVARMRSVIGSLQQSADVVIVSAPSLEDSLDAQLLAGSADGVVVAIEAGRAAQGDLTDAIEQMRSVNTPIVGGVLLAARKEGRQEGRGTGVRPTTGHRSRSGETRSNVRLGGPERRPSADLETDLETELETATEQRAEDGEPDLHEREAGVSGAQNARR